MTVLAFILFILRPGSNPDREVAQATPAPLITEQASPEISQPSSNVVVVEVAQSSVAASTNAEQVTYETVTFTVKPRLSATPRPPEANQ